MAKEARKLRRAAERQRGDSKSKTRASGQPLVQKPEMADPFSGAAIRSMLLRTGIPLVGAWLLGGLIAGVSQSSTVKTVALAIPGVLTVVIVGVVIWAISQAKKAKGVAGILQGVDTAEDRKAALEKLDTEFKSKDPAAIFAKAQLLGQEDPKAALEVLEQIDLAKVTPVVADEARSQRAMIHLIIGQVTAARDLVDGIELKRHQDAKKRALMASVIGEAWARSGQAKKAKETLSVFDPEDEAYADLRPQLYRAGAYAAAYASDIKSMRRCLKRLLDHDARWLGGFMGKKTHPLLQKEARKMLEQSGQLPRKMQIQRRL